jgi:hypothetical protein
MLMAHIDCFDKIIEDRATEMEVEQKSAAENKKVLLMNKMNRFAEWKSQFKDHKKIYVDFIHQSETLTQNSFDDDLIDQSL